MISPLWTQITDWLRINAPETYANLGPPASDEELSQVEAALGFEVPADLAELLRCNNGSNFEGGFFLLGGFLLCGTKDIISSSNIMREIVRHGNGDGWGSWWHDDWIPFGDTTCGGYLAYDSGTGRIFYKDNEGGPDSPSWASLTLMLEDTNSLLAGGQALHVEQPKSNGNPWEPGDLEIVDGALEWAF